MPLASDTGIDLPGDAAIPSAEPPPSATPIGGSPTSPTALPRREVFERAITQMTFEPGEAVFDSGQDLPYLFMVLEGDQGRRPDAGKRTADGVAGVGDLVGSLPSVLLAGMPDLLSARVAESTWEPRPQWGGRTNRSAIAIVDTVVERMDMRVLMSLMRRHAAWAMVGYHAMALHAMGCRNVGLVTC